MQPYLSDPMILAVYYSTKLHYLRFDTPCQENTPNHPLDLCGALSSQVLVNQCVCQTRSLVFFSHFLHKLFASRQPKCWHGSVKCVYSFCLYRAELKQNCSRKEKKAVEYLHHLK